MFPIGDYPDRGARDAAIADWLVGHDVELVVLAGYMALLTSPFLSRFPDAVVNIHPSLLPAFPGVRAIEQAIDYGVKVFGVTVHFVLDDGGVDTGPVIVQRAIELANATDPDAVREALRPRRARAAARGRPAHRARRRVARSGQPAPDRRRRRRHACLTALRVGFASCQRLVNARACGSRAASTPGERGRGGVPPRVASTTTRSSRCAACWRCRSSPS